MDWLYQLALRIDEFSAISTYERSVHQTIMTLLANLW
jgi:hypothetical protein